MELPGLTAVDDSEAGFVDLELLEVDDAGEADVLLDPSVLDGFWRDAKESLGEVAEGAMGGLLDLQDVLDLLLGQHALLDE